MSSQAGHLRHTWILPDHNLILTVPVGADNFVAVFAPLEVAHLAACVNLVNALTGGSVPEFDAPVCGSTARGEKRMLMG